MNLNVRPSQTFLYHGYAAASGRFSATRTLPKRKRRSKNEHGTTLPCVHMVGHGLDVVDVADFSRLMSESARPFLGRYFTDSELAAAGDGISKTERLASRFAIKEAVLKALGVGWGDGISFSDVETITLRSGAPTVVLYRRLRELQTARKITAWLVSASHTDAIAVGSVIALGA